MIKEKGFSNKKLNDVMNKTQLCDPFDIKLRDRLLDAIFAYDSQFAVTMATNLHAFPEMHPTTNLVFFYRRQAFFSSSNDFMFGRITFVLITI